MAVIVEKIEKYQPLKDIFDMVHDEQGAIFLDSSLENQLGQYSIIGLEPYLILEEKNGKFYCNQKLQEGNLQQFLKEYLEKNQEENPTDLPLISGGIGYFSYDYGRKFEAVTTRHLEENAYPDAKFLFYDLYLIQDCRKKEVYVAANGKKTDPREQIEQIQKVFQNFEKVRGNVASYKQRGKIRKQADREEYQNAISKIVEYLLQGDIYVMNMTQQLLVESNREPYEAYLYLQKNNPAPYSAYFNDGGFQILSVSPEQFLKVRNRKVITRPIKGTRPRGINETEDQFYKKELEESEKDKSELLMIVDLERNDLNKVCRPGSVVVSKMYEIETYATVFHLVSQVEGELEEGKDVIDLLAATFPGGSITGAPKLRAMEIIDELEEQRRGIYTGIMGYISLNGDCEFNIVIRTAVHEDGIYQIGVGGGVTYESDPAFEYEETLQKAKALLEALGVKRGEE